MLRFFLGALVATLIGGSASAATEVLIDDRPLPYARELWLPLIWLLITR